MDSDPPPDFSVPLVPALSEAETLASQILGGSLALSCNSVERLADLLLAEAPDSDGRFSQGQVVRFLQASTIDINLAYSALHIHSLCAH